MAPSTQPARRCLRPRHRVATRPCEPSCCVRSHCPWGGPGHGEEATYPSRRRSPAGAGPGPGRHRRLPPVCGCSLKQLLPQPPFSSLHKLPARSLLPTTSMLTQGALPPCRRRKGVRGPVGCARAPCSDLPCQAPGGAQGTAPNPPGSHGTPPSRHTHPNASHQLLQQAPATGHAEVYQSPEP